MDMLERYFILNLKSKLFDLIETINSSLSFEELQGKLLFTLNALMNATNITLYTSSEWENVWEITSSTRRNNTCVCIEFKSDEITDSILRRPMFIKGMDDYDLIMLLKDEEQVCGLLAIESECISNQVFPDRVLEEISELISLFLKKMRNIFKIALEEKRFKQLFRVTDKVHSSMDMESVLGEIIYTLQEVYPTFTYYLLLSHDNNSHSDLPIKDLEYDSENIVAMEAYVTGSIQFDESAGDSRSIIYAPLKGKQGVYGVLQVITPEMNCFPKNEIEFIKLLANTAGGALENAQLYQQSKRLVSDLQLINETSHRLNSNLRLTETMNFMADQIVQSFDAKEVGFLLTSTESNDIKVIDGSTSFFHDNEALKYIEYFKWKIDVEKDSLFVGDFRLDTLEQDHYKSIMAVPMVQTGHLKGFALVMHPDSYHFSFEDFKLLQSLIHHSTLAFTNSMLREELEKMVITDHLTKLYSRNYLDEKMKCSFVEDNEGTFILMDIDNFKKVNDTFGHQVGDEVIIQVANIIKENIRGTDVGARWGGEELAVYLPGISLDKGVTIAERLVKKVDANSRPHVSISCGVSYWGNEGDTYTALFKRADKALYKAKETGKNKVIVQHSETP